MITRSRCEPVNTNLLRRALAQRVVRMRKAEAPPIAARVQQFTLRCASASRTARHARMHARTHARTPQRLRVRACGCGARCRRPLIDSSQQRIWADFERLASARRSSRRWRSRAFLTSQVWRCAQRRATWSLYAVPASPVPFARLPKPWPSFQRSLLLV